MTLTTFKSHRLLTGSGYRCSDISGAAHLGTPYFSIRRPALLPPTHLDAHSYPTLLFSPTIHTLQPAADPRLAISILTSIRHLTQRKQNTNDLRGSWLTALCPEFNHDRLLLQTLRTYNTRLHMSLQQGTVADGIRNRRP